MHNRFVRLVLAVLVLTSGSAAAQTPGDFFEQKTSWFANETVEGASKHAEAPTQTPATVTVISKEDIETYGFKTIADVLNFASIGYFTQNDRRYDIAGGRGLFFFEDYNTRILVMLNGHPLNEPWNNFAGLGREMGVPLDIVERVEIVYGPSSLLYGGYSLMGMVNIVTRSGSSLAGGRVRAEVGSWKTSDLGATWGGSGTAGEQAEQTWDVLASIGNYRSDGENLSLPRIDVGYPVNDQGGTVYGGPQSGTDFERSPHAFLNARRGAFTLMVRSGSREKGVPLAPYESVYGSTDQYIKDTKSLAELRWDHAIGNGVHLSVRGFRDWYDYLEHDPYTAGTGNGNYLFILNGHDVDTGGEVRLTAQRGNHFLTGGAEHRSRHIVQSAFNDFGAAPNESILHDRIGGKLTVLYLQDEWRPSDRWTLVAGGNYADTKPGGHKAQPRVAVIFHPRDAIAIKGLWGRGFRSPSVFESAYKDGISYIENPALHAEEITSRELSVMWSAPNFSAQGYAFDSKLKGLIRLTAITDPSEVEGGVLSPTGDPQDLVGLSQYQSNGDVDSHGFGLGLRARRESVRAYVNVGWAKATFKPLEGAAFELPASANWIASAGAAWDNGDYSVALSARYVGSEQQDPDRTAPPTSAFTEANARLLWRTRIRYPVTVYLDARNLFASKGATAASTIYTPSQIPIEGRRFLLGGEVRF
jgi:outer membrane receptor protein involved in Fe transport